MENTSLTKKDYSERSFWRKVKTVSKKAGYETIYNALILFYVLRSPDTPLWCKSVIIGTLGYFISMIDAVPDLTPVLGYTDDLSLIMAAIGTLSAYITPEIELKAKQKAEMIFGTLEERHQS